MNALRTPHACAALAAAALLALVTGCGRRQPAPPAPSAPTSLPTLPAEVDARALAAINRGAAFLLTRQLPDGSWLQHPAVTSLACAALAQSPRRDEPAVRDAVNRGLDFVVGHAKPDGSIYNSETEEYPNYSTAVGTVCLALVGRPQDEAVLRAARAFLLGSQFQDVPSADASYGGIGYGKSRLPDLSNTQWALEALHVTEHLDREKPGQPATESGADLAWARAAQFLSRCQNLKDTNDQVWVVSDPDNRGGFVYMPGESKAGDTDDGLGLRSYGSMTYAGLKSMIYAKVAPDDPRVKAAVAWLAEHYTFSENPGMADAGLYYYLHTAAKALAALGQETLVDSAGTGHAWRQDLIESLLSRQRETGEWVNENARWWESVPELATAYCVLALEVARGQDAPFRAPRKP